MKRILQIVSSLKKDSGVMNVIMNYYRAINTEKYQFDFLYFTEHEKTFKDEITKLGGKFFFMEKPSIKKWIDTKIWLKNFFEYHQGEYIAIQLHEVYLNELYFPLAKKYGMANCFSYVHATQYSDKKLNALRNYIMCLPLKRNATKLLACSEAAGRFYYGEKAFKENRITVIKNAISCERFQFNDELRVEYRKKLDVDNKFVVGHVGRFNEQKNHAFLIDIFNKIVKKNKDCILFLVGDGPLKQDVQNQVKKLNLEENVKFLGRREDVHALFQCMDVFVLPSLFEGLPMVGVEAQAAGLPCVFSDKITKEISILECVEYLSLNDSVTKWAEIVLQYNGFKKKIGSADEVKKAGFDIYIEAQKLENFYKNIESYGHKI